MLHSCEECAIVLGIEAKDLGSSTFRGLVEDSRQISKEGLNY